MNADLRYAIEKLGKWRSVFAGWQLGTRPSSDPECQAVRDHREVTLMLRAECSALVGMLVRKGLVTEAEWVEALTREARQLDADMEERFPGVKTTSAGLVLDSVLARETMRGWKP